jgi:flagellin
MKAVSAVGLSRVRGFGEPCEGFSREEASNEVMMTSTQGLSLCGISRRKCVMGLRVNTNMASINAQRNLVGSTLAQQSAMERLSSGLRINKAADDAAGLAISEKLKAQVRSLNVAKRNANDGISLVQTAEGGLNEIHNILGRLRELSVQAASDTIGVPDREFLNKEYQQLKDEVARITNSLEFNGTPLLAGDVSDYDKIPKDQMKNSNSGVLEIQVGSNYWGGEGPDAVGNPNQTNIIKIDLTKVNTRPEVGVPGGLGIGLGDTVDADGKLLEAQGTGANTKERAQNSITTLDAAIQQVSSYRAYLGSVQSRLGSTVNNLAIQAENLSAANSRIRDTDFAEETAKMTQAEILKQGGVSVLAQANTSPQAALKLLG